MDFIFITKYCNLFRAFNLNSRTHGVFWSETCLRIQLESHSGNTFVVRMFVFLRLIDASNSADESQQNRRFRDRCIVNRARQWIYQSMSNRYSRQFEEDSILIEIFTYFCGTGITTGIIPLFLQTTNFFSLNS